LRTGVGVHWRIWESARSCMAVFVAVQGRES
jgi:hypothetical protein